MNCEQLECPFKTPFSTNEQSGKSAPDCLVAESVKSVSFEKGDFIFSQNQPACCVYVLTTGIAKIFSVTPDGREQIISFASPRKLMVGLQSLSHDRYADSVVAETKVTACKIRKRSLLRAVNEDPEVAIHLIDAMNAQLSMSRALMRVAEHHSAAAKIAAFLVLMLPDDGDIAKRFALPFSRSEIAGLLGLSEETVCRQMAKMRRADILYAPRGSIEIHDWDRLRAIADERQTIH
jgi:CRP/FNR family transcriptional regulator